MGCDVGRTEPECCTIEDLPAVQTAGASEPHLSLLVQLPTTTNDDRTQQETRRRNYLSDYPERTGETIEMPRLPRRGR